jgi:hypothetical protein
MILELFPTFLPVLPVGVPKKILDYSNRLVELGEEQMRTYPTDFKSQRRTCINFSHTSHSNGLVLLGVASALRKLSHLSYVASSLRSVLSNHTLADNMLNDWSAIDFSFIQNQVEEYSHCKFSVIDSGM